MWGLNDIMTHSLAYAVGEEEAEAKAKRERKKETNWHTGTPTEEGWYLLKCLYPEGSEYIYDTWYCTEDTELSENVVAWQKI